MIIVTCEGDAEEDNGAEEETFEDNQSGPSGAN